jgi:hypothetical protein
MSEITTENLAKIRSKLMGRAKGLDASAGPRAERFHDGAPTLHRDR